MSGDSLLSYDVTELDHDFFGVFLTKVEKNHRLGSHIFCMYLGKSTPLITMMSRTFTKSQPFSLNEVVRGPSTLGIFNFLLLFCDLDIRYFVRGLIRHKRTISFRKRYIIPTIGNKLAKPVPRLDDVITR